MDLRPGYKQTAVGILPDDWEVRTLGELGTVVRGGSPRPAGDPRYFNGDYIPWLTVAALTTVPDHQLHVSETFGFLTEEGSKRSRTLDRGTLIIANSGATLGVAKLLDVQCCANDGIAAILNQKHGHKEFLCHYINTQTKKLREDIATGNGQPNLNTGIIRGITVPFPKDEEQRAIATALSDVDALLDGLDRLIAKKRDLKQATMQQLLTGQTRLPGFSSLWIETSLGALGSFTKGRGVKKSEANSGSLPCVRYGELYTHHENVIREFYSSLSAQVASTAMRLQQGDVLFAGSGETKEEIGKCAAFTSNAEAYAGGDIVILRGHSQQPTFMGYYLNSAAVVAQKASRGQGDAVVHISARALGDIVVRLPGVDEQTAIARVLFDMDAELTTLEARRDKTRNLKKAMMQALLTGKTRLVKPEASDA